MALEFLYSFSFNHTNKSVAFYNDNTLLFSAGKLCVLMDLDSGKQSFFDIDERIEISAIVRCGVFIAAAIKKRSPLVCLFNTLTKTKKFYSAPDTMKSGEFSCLSVSVNLKFVAAQGSSPDWLLVIWFSHTQEIAITHFPAILLDASVFDISFHAGGIDELVVVGRDVFKLYEYQDEPTEETELFKEIIFEKYEKSEIYHTIAWPEKDNLVVGTSKGRLLFFRGIEMVHESILEEDLKRHGLQLDDFEFDENDKAVTSIVAIPEQLLCAFAGFCVLIYEGEEISSYALTKFIYLTPDRHTSSIPGEIAERPDQLLSIIVSLSGKDVIATSRNGQILQCCNFSEGGEYQYFTALIQKSHKESITGIDVSRGKPLIASCSKRILMLWNYSDKSLEVRKLFKNDIKCVALHPTGLYVALGFEYFCRVFSVLHHDLKERKLLTCKNCSKVVFSAGGHMLGIVNDSFIEVYSFITCELMFKLDGHAGLVTSFDWTENDTKLISCDNRGVICDWDLVSLMKLWENTAILSYLSVSVNRCGESVIAASSDFSVRCIKKSSLQWELKCKGQLTRVLYCCDGESFYVGTSNGCIEFYKYPRSDESIAVHAHCGRISDLKHDFKSQFLISSGSDGCIFLWRVPNNDIHGAFEEFYSKLCLVDKSDFARQNDKLEQLRLSLQHIDTASDCEFELNCIKHEELMTNIAINHTQCIDELSEKIISVKEEMQNFSFYFDSQNYRSKLDLKIRQQIIDTTFELNEAYKKSNSYVHETNKIILNYENTINSLTAKHARYSCNQSNENESVKEKMKDVENTLFLEKEITKQAHSLEEEYKKQTEKELTFKTATLNSTQKALLEGEKSRSIQLKSEIEKLEWLSVFVKEDSQNRKNKIFGTVDYYIKEKINAITILKLDFQKLEFVLASKEKNSQIQETKFCELRKRVGSSKKYHSVFRTSINVLLEESNKKDLEILTYTESIKKLSTHIPQLEDEIKLTESLYSNLNEKLKESLDGYHKKEKLFRDTQDVISKYTTMLHQCIGNDCDPVKLRNDILSLFEKNRIGFDHETGDTQLLNEYAFQINKLGDTYDIIKGEPAKSMRDKSMSEFRLSMENSKLLRDVHDMQKESERLRLIINDLETALGLQAVLVKSTKLADKLRDKIDFVLKVKKRSVRERMKQIACLDMFIEEQQKEIERFQTILAAKQKKVAPEKT